MPSKKPRRVWVTILDIKNDNMGRKWFLIPLGFAASPFDKGEKLADANMEVKRLPWIARQVRPPVVRPVRKMARRLVFCMLLILA